MKPNIFEYASKELSQDAFIAWLLKWADPRLKNAEQFSFDDLGLSVCGTKLIREMLFSHDVTLDTKIVSVDSGNRWEGVDIWCEVSLADGKKHLIIIEDKSHTLQHPEQLYRYRELALDYCSRNHFMLPVCIYLKTGNESHARLEKVRRIGYRVFDRKLVVRLLAAHRQIQNSIFQDFLSRISKMEEGNVAYEQKKIGSWTSHDWQGFFGFLDREIGLAGWDHVSCPGGGSWQAVLNWDYWKGYPVYVQLEEGRLAFKITTEEEEPAPENTQRAEIRNEFNRFLIASAHEQSRTEITKPLRFGTGVAMTVAVVNQEHWLGRDNEVPDMERVVSKLRAYCGFLKGLTEEKSYASAG